MDRDLAIGPKSPRISITVVKAEYRSPLVLFQHNNQYTSIQWQAISKPQGPLQQVTSALVVHGSMAAFVNHDRFRHSHAIQFEYIEHHSRILSPFCLGTLDQSLPLLKKMWLSVKTNKPFPLLQMLRWPISSVEAVHFIALFPYQD